MRSGWWPNVLLLDWLAFRDTLAYSTAIRFLDFGGNCLSIDRLILRPHVFFNCATEQAELVQKRMYYKLYIVGMYLVLRNGRLTMSIAELSTAYLVLL